MMTHYKRLGVLSNAPPEVIRAAYKALAQTHHPDRNIDNPAATEEMQEINQAYAVLSDPQKRAEYDRWLIRQQTAAAQVEWTPPPRPSAAASSGRHQVRNKVSVPVFFLSLIGAMVFSLSYYTYSTPRRPSVATPPQVFAQNNSGKDVPSGNATDNESRVPPDNQSGVPPRAALTAKQLADCVFAAADTYNVPPADLLGVLSAAHGGAGEEILAAHGSADLGLLQINTWWVPKLAHLWHVDEDKARAMVRDDSCINVGVGAWILQIALQMAGDLPAKIAAYDAAARHVKSGRKGYVADALRLIKVYKDVRAPSDLLGHIKQ